MQLGYAFILPFIFALVSVLDKYIVSKRVKNYKAFLVVVAMAHFLIISVLSFFLEWDQLNSYGVFFAILSGIFIGISNYSSYKLLRTEDASSVVGFSYLYPIFVGFLSFVFLKESFDYSVYIGVFLTVCGAVFISSRWPDFKEKALAPMLNIIFFTGLYELFIKVASGSIPPWQGIVLTSVGIIISFLPMLFLASARKDILAEMKNLKFALLTESVVFLGFLTTYLAMEKISATIVTAISSTQPLVILFYEMILVRFGIHLARENWREKIMPILLVVAGIAIICLKS